MTCWIIDFWSNLWKMYVFLYIEIHFTDKVTIKIKCFFQVLYSPYYYFYYYYYYFYSLPFRRQDSRYRILTDSARKLNAQGSQLGDCIQKAWPYYEALREAEKVQENTQKAAQRYERAVSVHTAARKMENLAEQCLLADRNTMDPTWQEMLNHATAKVNEAEEERLRSESEHKCLTQRCQEAKTRVQNLHKAFMRVILKSKPYFELKAQFNDILEEHKSKVVQLKERVAKEKTHFLVTLRNLEQISEQIHAQTERIRPARKRNRAHGGRSSSVGAESEGVIKAGTYGGLRQWSEKHREQGWGQREQVERAGLDSMSVISLQNIASDLEKCDSVDDVWRGERDGGRKGVKRSGSRKRHHRSVSF
uniref:SH3 domain-binding protein 5 n=1 Tax=Astyanax mexicanus TaxID=7994 RepID=A0A3B1KH45_ASTMX